MYWLFIDWDVPIRYAKVVAEKLRHIDIFIQRGLQNVLPRFQGYKNVPTANSKENA